MIRFGKPQHPAWSRTARTPEGRPYCRYCNGSVPKPRRTFCSEHCVHEWKLRSSGQYLRDQVMKRDNGVCRHCRTDTEALLAQVRLMAATAAADNWASTSLLNPGPPSRFQVEGPEAEVVLARRRRTQEWFDEDGGDCLWSASHPVDGRPYCPYEARLLERMILEKQFGYAAKRTLWEVEHVVPVCEGGGLCGMENVITLCQKCHLDSTRRLARKRAQDRKRARQAVTLPA